MWVVTKETPDEFSSNVLPFYKQQQNRLQKLWYNQWLEFGSPSQRNLDVWAINLLSWANTGTMHSGTLVNQAVGELAALHSFSTQPSTSPNNPLPHTLHRNVSSNTLSTLQLWKWFIFTEPTMTSFHNIWSMKGAVTAKVQKLLMEKRNSLCSQSQKLAECTTDIIPFSTCIKSIQHSI